MGELRVEGARVRGGSRHRAMRAALLFSCQSGSVRYDRVCNDCPPTTRKMGLVGAGVPEDRQVCAMSREHGRPSTSRACRKRPQQPAQLASRFAWPSRRSSAFGYQLREQPCVSAKDARENHAATTASPSSTLSADPWTFAHLRLPDGGPGIWRIRLFAWAPP